MPEQPAEQGENRTRDDAGRFRPGVSGNPSGRGNAPSLLAALRAELDAREASGRPALRAIAERLVEMALAGDIRAIREVLDRLDGKPLQAVSVDATAPLMLQPVRLERRD